MIVLNVLSGLAVLAAIPVTLYIGIWGMLGPAYGRPQDAALGIAIAAAPIVITAVCVIVSIRLLRAGNTAAPVVAGLPLLAAAVALITLAL